MTEFFRQNALTVILLVIGLFFMFMTYGAYIASIRSGRFVSGVPFVGGFFVFLAFIVSPWKLLSLLCVLDLGVWMTPCIMLIERQEQKRALRFISGKDFESVGRYDKTKKLIIKAGEEELEWPLCTNQIYRLADPLLRFMICFDKDDKAYLIYTKEKGFKEPLVIPVDGGRAVVDGLTGNRNGSAAEIRIENKKEEVRK